MVQEEALSLIPQNSPFGGDVTAFGNAAKMAEWLAASDMVPEAYKGKPQNCMVALDLSMRMQISPLTVMQNMYMVSGKPTLASQFLIGMVNACGRFAEPLTFEMMVQGDDTLCRAKTVSLQGQVLYGPTVSISMAKAEGWYGKKGSKWQTMPELMLHYRAGTFFARIYAPDLTLGFQTKEEVQDIGRITILQKDINSL